MTSTQRQPGRMRMIVERLPHTQYRPAGQGDSPTRRVKVSRVMSMAAPDFIVASVAICPTRAQPLTQRELPL